MIWKKDWSRHTCDILLPTIRSWCWLGRNTADGRRLTRVSSTLAAQVTVVVQEREINREIWAYTFSISMHWLSRSSCLCFFIWLMAESIVALSHSMRECVQGSLNIEYCSGERCEGADYLAFDFATCSLNSHVQYIRLSWSFKYSGLIFFVWMHFLSPTVIKITW